MTGFGVFCKHSKNEKDIYKTKKGEIVSFIKSGLFVSAEELEGLGYKDVYSSHRGLNMHGHRHFQKNDIKIIRLFKEGLSWWSTSDQFAGILIDNEEDAMMFRLQNE